MKCYFCQSTVNINDEKCPSCSKALKKHCVPCDILYEAKGKFCISCGGKLEDISKPTPKLKKNPLTS